MTRLLRIFWHVFGGLARRFLALVELNWPEREVVLLYNQGLPVGEIGERVGYSESGIRHVLRRAEDVGVEVERRPVGRPRIDREPILKNIDSALDRGFEIGISAKYAAARIGCSESTVWRALRGD